MKELHRQWGRNVANGRLLLKLTQVGLAAAAGCTQQTISSIERGEYAPRDDLKLKIAEALHQEVRQLFPLVRIESKRDELAAATRRSA